MEKRRAQAAAECPPPSKKVASGKGDVNPQRVRELRPGAVEGSGPVIYWCVCRSTGRAFHRCYSMCILRARQCCF